ncbi:MAG TPA: hypothetical protein ENJ09_12915 [Planctomycetes bacterium]|nr:hypothetical protein [Planctomycetota bacterium]
MSNRTSDSENDRKSPSQDILGLILFGLFGFAAVSIFLHLRGQVSQSPVTMPVSWLVNAIGSAPGLVLALGVAGLGLALFLRPDAIPSARHALGIIGLAIGVSLILGGIFPDTGGKIGGILPSLLGGTAGWILGLIVGAALLIGTVIGVWGGNVRSVSPDPLVPSALVPPRRVSSDGVSAAEAMALQPEPPPATPAPSAPVPAADVRTHGGVPAGAQPLEVDPERGGDAASDGGPELDRETEPEPVVAELAEPDLAPEWESVEEATEEEADAPAVASNLPEPSRLGEPEHGVLIPPAPAWESAEFEEEDEECEEEVEPDEELAAELEEEEEDEEEYEEEVEPDEELAAELEEEEEDEEEYEEEAEPEEELAAKLEEEEEAEEEYEEEAEPEEELAAELEEEEEAEEEYEEEAEPEEELAAELEEEEEAEEEYEEEAEPEEELAAELEEEEEAEEEYEEEAEPEEELAAELEEEEEDEEEYEEEVEPEEEPDAELEERDVPRPTGVEQMGLFDALSSSDAEAAATADREETAADASDTLVPVKAEAPAPEPEPASAPQASDPVRARIFEAGLLILEENRVAVSMLQRRFTIDFDEACELLDHLQELGLIGPYIGGRNREILLTMEEWRELESEVLQTS